MGSSAGEAFDPALGVHIDIQPIGPKIHRHGRVRCDPAERACARPGLHDVSPSIASPLAHKIALRLGIASRSNRQSGRRLAAHLDRRTPRRRE